MAKQQNTADSAEVVIFFARARGGGSVVAESVRALAEAVDRAAQPRITGEVRKALPANVKHDEKSLFDSAEPVRAPNGEDVTAEIGEAAGFSGPRRKRGDGDPKDRNAGISLVGDIDFVPSGKPSLKDFFGEKNPGSDMDQVLVLCHFLQHTLKYPKFGPGHILSGFRHIGKPVPKDLKGTIRNMRREKVWLNFTDIEHIRLSTEGDNRVEHDLGNNNGEGGAE